MKNEEQKMKNEKQKNYKRNKRKKINDDKNETK